MLYIEPIIKISKSKIKEFFPKRNTFSHFFPLFRRKVFNNCQKRLILKPEQYYLKHTNTSIENYFEDNL